MELKFAQAKAFRLAIYYTRPFMVCPFGLAAVQAWDLTKVIAMDKKTARQRTGAFALALMFIVALVNGPAVREALSEGPDYLILNPEAD